MSDQEQKSADRYLVGQIRAGDEEAWNQLIARYSGRLVAFARRKLASPDDAEDVVQETFIGFVQSLPNFDESRSLETYLFAILRYQLIRAYRKVAKGKGVGFMEGDYIWHSLKDNDQLSEYVERLRHELEDDADSFYAERVW